jgi:hypothetical protein
MLFRLENLGRRLTIISSIRVKSTEINTKGSQKADISKKKLSLEEITTYNSRIYQLYMNVAKTLHSTLFLLTENHFVFLKKIIKR